MDSCKLGHIPDRLKRKNRPVIEVFRIEEEIYRRCKRDVLDNPFKSISICELSHNRQGLADNILSQPDDVLFKITGEGARYDDFEICTLRIVDLTSDDRYHKQYQQQKNGQTYVAEMKLLHDPDNCMYPHSVFRVWLNETIVDYGNYDNTLRRCNEIRTRIKEELASMIIRREINQGNSPGE